MITIRPATAQDLTIADGVAPARSTRSIAVEEDGEVIAVGGFFPLNTRYMVFSHLTPRFRGNRRIFIKAMRTLVSMIAERPAMPCIAIADPNIPGSDVLLKHIGFTCHHGSLYEWPGPQQPQR